MPTFCLQTENPPSLKIALERFGEEMELDLHKLTLDDGSVWYYREFWEGGLSGGEGWADATVVLSDRPVTEAPGGKEPLKKDPAAQEVLKQLVRYSVTSIPWVAIIGNWDVRVALGNLEPASGREHDGGESARFGYKFPQFGAPMAVHLPGGIELRGSYRITLCIDADGHFWNTSQRFVAERALQHGEVMEEKDRHQDPHARWMFDLRSGPYLRRYPNATALDIGNGAIFEDLVALLGLVPSASAEQLEKEVESARAGWEEQSKFMKEAQRCRSLDEFVNAPVREVGPVEMAALLCRPVVDQPDESVGAHACGARVGEGEWPLFKAAFSRSDVPFAPYGGGRSTRWLVSPRKLAELLGAHPDSELARKAKGAFEEEERARRRGRFAAETRRMLERAVTGLPGEQPRRGAHPEGEKRVVDESDRENAYGGGRWWVIADDGVWHVVGNGADGDDWSRNNLPGAIGIRYRKHRDLVEILSSRCQVVGGVPASGTD